MLKLRQAQRTDSAAIFGLIGELADFEQLRAEVTGTAAALEQHLFDEPRYARALLAEWGHDCAGFALYFFNYSTFRCRPGIYLEDLYVRPQFRGRGVGRALLAAVEAVALEHGCGRLEWSVLDWNAAAIGFYRRFGARAIEGWTVYRKTLP
ncbi:MAG: GNAT family N-acetyltransferase [Steroidobacterales bacterium]